MVASQFVDLDTDNETPGSSRSSDMAGPESPKVNAEGGNTFPAGTIAKLVGTHHMKKNHSITGCHYFETCIWSWMKILTGADE